MRRKGHYENTFYDGRNYGQYSKEKSKWYASDKSLGNLRKNKTFMTKNRVKSLGDGFYSYEPITYSENRYISEGLDFTPSIWGLVLAILFLLALSFLFKGLSDNSSLFDTSLSLADIVCDYGSSFREEVVNLSNAFNDEPVGKFTLSSLFSSAFDSGFLRILGVTVFHKISAIVGFLIGFVYNFVIFIVRVLVLIFA